MSGKLREAEGSSNQRRDLAPDADDLRLAVLHLHADLNPTSVVDLHALFDDERRGGQLPVRREVRTAGPRGTSGRRVFDPEVRREAAGMDRGIGRDGLQGERIAHDLLPELRQDLAKVPKVRVQSLDDLKGPDRDLERLDSRRRDLRDQALQTDVLRSYTEGARERLDVLQLSAERGLALGHDHLSHLATLADQFEGQHADLQFLIDHGGTIRMWDESFLGRNEGGPDRRMARERDLSARGEDPIPVVRGRVARGKNERRLGDVHLPRDPQHLRG